MASEKDGLKDEATVIVGNAHFYTATVGTAAPTKTALKGGRETALTDWTELGHTSVDKVFNLSREGGEITVKSSLQKKALRTTTAPVKWSMELELLQFDAKTLKRYLGANAVDKDGVTYAKSNPTAEQCALLMIAEDGENTLILHAEKAEISANGSLDVSSIEDFAAIPLRFTFLDGDTGTVGIGLHTAG